MDAKYINELNLNPNHRYELTSSNLKGLKGGWDTDYYTYDEFDQDGKFVKSFTVKDSTKAHPPFNRVISLD